MSKNFDELINDITSFYYDWDPYEFNDNYEDYDMALEDTKNILSSKEHTDNLIYDLKNINEDIKDDNDIHIKELSNRCKFLISNLEEYKKTFESEIKM